MNSSCAIVCIAKNERDYIEEFITHHLGIGFEKIVICDNNDESGETYHEQLSQYISEGKVEIVSYRGMKCPQMRAYREQYVRLADEGKYGWCAFLDIDEHIHLVANKTISDFVSEPRFENANQIGMNWMTMSDSGNVRKDSRPLEVRFTTPIACINPLKSNGFDRHVKVIARLKSGFTPDFRNPHCISASMGVCAPNGENFGNSPFNDKISYDIAYIKHFHFKTIQEWVENKMAKGWADTDSRSIDAYTAFAKFNVLNAEKFEYLIEYICKHSS